MKAIVENKDKIHSNILHNSVDHILKSQVGTDAGIGWHPWVDSAWEQKINKWAKHSLWVGLFDILIPNKKLPNFYEFKHNLPLSKSNKLGFAARCEGRKNPHYLDGLESLVFTNSFEFNLFWNRHGDTLLEIDNVQVSDFLDEYNKFKPATGRGMRGASMRQSVKGSPDMPVSSMSPTQQKDFVSQNIRPWETMDQAEDRLLFNSSGTLQWRRTLGGSGSDYGYGIAVDSSGNSYVTGYTTGGGYGNDDIITAKYDTNGNIQWQRILGGTGNDGADAIAVDSSGNAYVFAHTESAGAGNYDMLVAKYNSSGSIQWQKTVGTGPGILEWSQGIEVDSSGNIYLAGYTIGSGVGAGSYDFLITKLNSSGAFQWSRTLGGSSLDYGRAIAVDSSGNVYVTGETASTGTGMYEGLIVKYDSSGTLQWQRIFYGSQNEYLNGIGVDNSGNVYVGGRTASSGEGDQEFLIAKLPDDGTGTGTYGDFTYADSSSLLTAGSRTLTVSNSNLNEAALSYTDANAGSLGEDTPTLTSSITSMATSNLTAENYIGISDGAYTNGQTATIQLIGSVDDAQSSLTPGQKYYVQNDGTLAESGSVFAGTAVSSTSLVVKS